MRNLLLTAEQAKKGGFMGSCSGSIANKDPLKDLLAIGEGLIIRESANEGLGILFGERIEEDLGVWVQKSGRG